jgi:hypothetical protein
LLQGEHVSCLSSHLLPPADGHHQQRHRGFSFPLLDGILVQPGGNASPVCHAERSEVAEDVDMRAS